MKFGKDTDFDQNFGCDIGLNTPYIPKKRLLGKDKDFLKEYIYTHDSGLCSVFILDIDTR